MEILGFLEKRGNRITVFKDKNKYIFHGTEYKVFQTKYEFDKYVYQNKYGFIGVIPDEWKRRERVVEAKE